MKRICYILVALALLPGIHRLRAQQAAVRTNLLGLLTANLNIEASYLLQPKWSAHLALQAKPWAYPLPAPVGLLRYVEGLDNNEYRLAELGTIKHTENYTIQPSLRYWSNGVYNRGLFMGLHGMATLFKYGGDKFDPKYREGWGLGAGVSLGYSYELSPRLNLECEVGGAMLYRTYRMKPDGIRGVSYEPIQDIIPTVSRLGISLVYLL